MKKILFIIVLIALLVAGGLATLVALTFNPEAYRKQVMASILELTGRDLTVGGQTIMTWTPVPTIVMEKVRLSNQPQSPEKTMLSVEKVRVQIEWSSLLKSPLVVKSIELQKPVLLLERLESNRANFAFPFLLEPEHQLPETDFLTGAATSAKVEQISIQDGTIQYVNKITNQSMTLTQIDGQMNMESIRGPFKFDGKASLNDNELTAKISSGLFKASSPVDMALKINEPKSKTSLDISGQLTPDATDKWFSGVATFTVQTPNTLLGVLGAPGLSNPLNVVTVGNTTIEMTPTKDTFKDFTIRFGEGENATALTGTVSQTTGGAQPSWQVNVGTNLFNVDDWQDYVQLFGWDDLGADKKYPNVSFQFKAQSVPYQKDAIKDVDIVGQYQAGQVRLTKVSAVMPGRTNLTASGVTDNKAGKRSLTMQVTAETDSAKTLFSWLWPDNEWLKNTKMLQKASLKGKVELTPSQFSIAAQEIKMDDATISGSIHRTDEKQTEYRLNLNVANMNIDAYTGWQKTEKPVELEQLPWIIRSLLERTGEASDATVQMTTDMRDSILFGIPITSTRVSGNLDKNTLKIDTLTMKDTSVNLDINGQIIGIGRPQPVVSQLNVKLDTKNAMSLWKQLGVVSKLPLINQATETNMTMTANGGQDGTWQVSATGNLGDTSIRLNGALISPETAVSFKDFSFDIAHPNFQKFVTLVQPEKEILPKLVGAFKAKGMVNGDKVHWVVKDALVGVGTQRITGTASYNGKGGRQSVIAELQSPSLDINKLMTDEASLYASVSGFSSQAFNWGFLNDWDGQIKLSAGQLLFNDWDIRNTEIEASAQDKKLTLKRLEGSAAVGQNTPVQMRGELDWSGTPAMALDLFTQNMPLRQDFMALNDWVLGNGTLSLKTSLKAQGKSPAEMSKNLNGEGEILIKDAQMIGANVEQMVPVITRAIQRGEEQSVFEPEIKRVLHSGKTPVTSLQGAFTVANGTIRMMDATVKMPNATANPTQVIWDLPKQTMEVSIPVQLVPLSNLPPFVLGVSVSRGKGIYKPIYADLVRAIDQRTKADKAEKTERQQKQEAQIASQNREDRIREAENLTEMARVMVNNMEIQIKSYPNDKAERILQSARDALAVVNQIAVREDLTDAQLIQQIEQARLVMIKNDEFLAIMGAETLMSTQQKLNDYLTKGESLVKQMQAWSNLRPEIVVLGKLVENATQNLEVIRKAGALLDNNRTAGEVTQIMTAVSTAFERIEAAYDRAKQFNVMDEAPIEDVSAPKTIPLGGAIGRAN